MKAMTAKGIEQCQFFLVLSATDYGLSLTIMSQTNLQKLDRVQNVVTRITEDISTETMWFMLVLPLRQTNRKTKKNWEGTMWFTLNLPLRQTRQKNF